MSTQPRSPREHYAESERLLEVAEDAAIDPGIRDLAARMATAHAVLTLSPRRSRKRPAQHPGNGLAPTVSWGGE
jgi:hypothetical protein